MQMFNFSSGSQKLNPTGVCPPSQRNVVYCTVDKLLNIKFNFICLSSLVLDTSLWVEGNLSCALRSKVYLKDIRPPSLTCLYPHHYFLNSFIRVSIRESETMCSVVPISATPRSLVSALSNRRWLLVVLLWLHDDRASEKQWKKPQKKR